MNLSEAIETIRFHAVDPQGANLLMMNGENPGLAALTHLYDALEHVYSKTVRNSELPRDVALGCGTLLQYKQDYRYIMKMRHESEYDELRRPLAQITQRAYDILAGDYSFAWQVDIPEEN